MGAVPAEGPEGPGPMRSPDPRPPEPRSPDPRPPVERSIAQVRRNRRSPVKGRAFPLDEWHVVTCAHVVNEVLDGRDQDDVSEPDDDRVRLEFRLADPEDGEPPARWGHVVVWLPDERSGVYGRDVAVLKLDQRLPSGAGVPDLDFWAPSTGRLQMFGRPGDGTFDIHVTGRGGGLVEGGLQVDVDSGHLRDVEPGFSGGPVWVPDTTRVVGMVHARGFGDEPRFVFVIPAPVLGEARARLPDPSTIPAPTPVLTPMGQGIGAWRPFPTQRVVAARQAMVRWWTWATRWSWRPRAVPLALVCGLVGAALSFDRGFDRSLSAEALVWAVLYGVRVGLVAYAVGVVADLVAGAVQGRRRGGESSTGPPAAAGRRP